MSHRSCLKYACNELNTLVPILACPIPEKGAAGVKYEKFRERERSAAAEVCDNLL